ncbi:hypothetical protein M0804_009210 [Polistes exclamans]|nr:hypothetical protein M0804_009210 [Polistes exclamans]
MRRVSLEATPPRTPVTISTTTTSTSNRERLPMSKTRVVFQDSVDTTRRPGLVCVNPFSRYQIFYQNFVSTAGTLKLLIHWLFLTVYYK